MDQIQQTASHQELPVGFLHIKVAPLSHRRYRLRLAGRTLLQWARRFFVGARRPTETRFWKLICAGKLDLDLREFGALQHEELLFEEANAKMVLKHKKLSRLALGG